jgi:hypothetical protein
MLPGNFGILEVWPMAISGDFAVKFMQREQQTKLCDKRKILKKYCMASMTSSLTTDSSSRCFFRKNMLVYGTKSTSHVKTHKWTIPQLTKILISTSLDKVPS